MMLDATRKALVRRCTDGRRAAALAEVAAAERVLEAAERLIKNNAYPDELAAALRDLAALKEQKA